MTDEIPSWLEEETLVLEDFLEDDAQTKTRSSAQPTFSPGQIAILSVLVLILCAVFAGTGFVVYLNSNQLFGQPTAQPIAVENNVTAPTPSPEPAVTPTVTEIPSPVPTPTSMLPQARPTLEPSPTATFAVAPDFINKDKILEITRFVEFWRDLTLPDQVPITFLTRRQLQEQWRDESFDMAALEAVQTQQEFYAALGLIEPDVDLMGAIFAAQTDILLGYYAPDEKTMYIIAESVMMFAEEELTFAHEYVHALQDYHFDLANLYTDDMSADTLLAMQSLPEGDARLVEDLFASENVTQDQLDYTAYRYLFQEHPTLDGVSPALGIFTFFPYTAGEYFSIYLFIEGDYTWELVNRAYSQPPVSTEQILHPEKYLAGEMPIDVSLPNLAPALDENWREIDRDVLGEAGFLVWLVDKVDETTAADAAAGWDGDSYTLWINNANQRVLAEQSLWESEREAVEFFDAFVAYMNLREGKASSKIENGAYIWQFAEGATLLTRTKRQVIIIIAPDQQMLDNIRQQFIGF